ncbi:MAG: class I SAM-dependent methyltransferase [Ilumatobacteraceae bacterium]
MVRTTAFAQERSPSLLDRGGRWLSTVRMRRYLGDVRGLRAADIGCGHDAALSLRLFDGASSLLLVDVAIDATLAADHRRLLCGHLPDVLDQIDTESIDALICNNVLEHLDDPEATAHAMHRILSPGGVCVVNVPSWRGKRFLELAAFRLGVAPREEMDDHKAYYDPRDLWPLLVRAGFRPSEIKVTRHKGGLNTIARCHKGA